MNISSPYLDTIISLALIYALLSILVSILLEIWNQQIKARGRTLQNSIIKLLDDPLNHNFGYLIYQHPIINRMRKDENSYPAYISAENFTNALIDTLSQMSIKTEFKQEDDKYIQLQSREETLELRLLKGVKDLNPSEFKDLLINFIDRNTENGTINIKALKNELGTWYDDYMDRVGGQYKTNNRPKMIGLGMIVAVVLNVDTIHLTKVLFLNQELRNRMVVEAQKVNEDYKNASGDEKAKLDYVIIELNKRLDENNLDSSKSQNISNYYDSLLNRIGTKDLDSANKVRKDAVFRALSRWEIPIGYNREDAPISWFRKKTKTLYDYRNTAQENVLIEYFEARNRLTFWGFIKWAIGILISGVALGYGSPFWFETLSKLINIRNAGQKPNKMNPSK